MTATVPGRTRATGWSSTRLVTARPVPSATRTGPRRMPFVLLIAGLLIGGLCALLALNTAAAAAELRRQSLTQSNAASADAVQQLKAELAARQAPGALASAAAALGMVPADHPAFLRILPDGKVLVMGSPQAATAAPTPQSAAPPTQKPTQKPTHKPTQKPGNTATKPPTRSTGAHR